MSWVRDFVASLREKKRAEASYPRTGSVLEEQKQAAVFDGQRRYFQERIAERKGQILSFDRKDADGKSVKEASLVDDLRRRSVSHSAAFHGIGSAYPVTPNNAQAYFELSRAVRGLQSRWGSDDPLAQAAFRLFLGVDDSMGTRSFREEDLSFDVVTIPLQTPMPFANMPAEDLTKIMEGGVPQNELFATGGESTGQQAGIQATSNRAAKQRRRK